jgi:hypothetical protein
MTYLKTTGEIIIRVITFVWGCLLAYYAYEGLTAAYTDTNLKMRLKGLMAGLTILAFSLLSLWLSAGFPGFHYLN